MARRISSNLIQCLARVSAPSSLAPAVARAGPSAPVRHLQTTQQLDPTPAPHPSTATSTTPPPTSVPSSSSSALPASSTPVSPSAALSLIRSQPSHYVLGQIHQRTYLLTPGDLLTIPRMRPALPVGTILGLHQIKELGSRDWTLRGAPWVQGVNVPLTVVEHTRGSMEKLVKFKRRKGYKKTIPNKQGYTRLRVGQFEWSAESEAASMSVSPAAATPA